MLRLYTILLALGLPYYLMRSYFRQKRNTQCHFPQAIKHRLGRVADLGSTTFWIHAVSAGEVLAASPLIEHLQQQFKQTSITLSCGSINGIAHANRLQHQLAKQGYRLQVAMMPIDLPWMVERFLQRVQPKVYLVVENDIWPNTFQMLKSKGIACFVVSQNLSDRSFFRQRRWRFAKKLTRQTFNAANHLFVQTPQTQQRLQQLGVQSKRISVSGNLKFNTAERMRTPLPRLFQQIKQHYSLIWTAGSTYKGEEEMLWLAHQQVLKQHPQALLIYAPRQVSHFQDSWQRLQDFCEYHQLRCSQFSQTTNPAQMDILLLDASGLLVFAYAIAMVAFVGGSLVDQGGHNLLEPASLGIASLSGPFIGDQQVIYQPLLEAAAITLCHNQQQLNTELLKLLECSELRADRGRKMKQIVQQNQVDFEPITALIRSVLDTN